MVTADPARDARHFEGVTAAVDDLVPRAEVLRPGLLSYFGEDNGSEVFVVIDEGILVKADRDLRVACQRAVIAGDLPDARSALAAYLHGQSEHERKARAVLRRIWVSSSTSNTGSASVSSVTI